MKLNAPKKLTWLLAIILGVLGLLGVLLAPLPILTVYAFWFVFVGLVLLVLGNFLKGL